MKHAESDCLLAFAGTGAEGNGEVMEAKGFRSRLMLDLGDLKPLLVRCAQDQGKRPAVWAREVLEHAVRKRSPVQIPVTDRTRDVVNREGKDGKVKFGCYLTLEQSSALRDCARASRLSRAEYVGRMVLGEVLADRAQVLAALGTLAQQLPLIERELSRVARAMKADAMAGSDLAVVTKAAHDVQVQMKALSEVLESMVITRRGRRQGGV
jgi:hypothetical protein